MKPLRVEVWSDVACPWCYVGKRRLEAALARFPHRDAVVVAWRSFELDPSAPRTPEPMPHAERIARKYGMSVAQAEAANARLVALAKADGLELRFDRIRHGNTFDAHRVLHLAAKHGLQDAAKERLLRAYFTEGESMGDHATLARLAGEVGLDVDEVAAMLATDELAREVRDDEAAARRLGITGVPFFLVGRYAVSGAQPAEVLLGALRAAWDEAAAAPATPGGAEACGPDGCT